MITVILLDTGILGLITYPMASRDGNECGQWLLSLSSRGYEAKIPEIADYEIRRELLRMDKFSDIQVLDNLKKILGYVPITTETMLLAAEFWAQARKQGRPTAHDKALDGDVILAAQATILANRGNDVIIATTNVGHLSRFVKAKEWRDIA
jgi:predicted nucleic acid-binding protein